jgi:hypothetical protein
MLFFFFQDMEFRCCYCNRGFITFEEVIHHSIEDHPLQELQYKFIRLDVATGKKQICTKVYGFSPNEAKMYGNGVAAEAGMRTQPTVE